MHNHSMNDGTTHLAEKLLRNADLGGCDLLSADVGV